MNERDLVLVVESPEGPLVRRIQPASPLRSDMEPGYATEEATRSAAALWGLPDFIFKPVRSANGTGRREIGDALLVAGDLAACIQVKTRVAIPGPAQRERSWLDKKLAIAKRQADGSIRRIRSIGPIALVNERDREVLIDGAQLKWVSVIIVEHPGIGEYQVGTSDAVVLLRRDWEFLFSQLRSTYVVLQYLHHVAAQARETVVLGDEPVRYYRIAQASITRSPDALDPRLVGEDPVVSAPLFPIGQAQGSEIVRWVLEDIAALPTPADVDATMLNTVLAAVDATPLAVRQELSTSVLHWLGELTTLADRDTTHWRSRRFVSGTQHQVIFGVCNRPWARDVQERFGTLLELRHREHIERTPDRHDLLSVGVLLTPSHRGWDTTIVATRGDAELEPEWRRLLERLWGTWEKPGTDMTLFSELGADGL